MHRINFLIRKKRIENNKGEKVEFKGDYCLISVGRKPYTEGLGLEKVGVEVNERGQVSVNDHLQTNISNIFLRKRLSFFYYL